jgi:hypothetical protein
MNRRAFEVTVITIILMQPVIGLVRLWVRKTYLTTSEGSLAHETAEVVNIITG